MSASSRPFLKIETVPVDWEMLRAMASVVGPTLGGFFADCTDDMPFVTDEGAFTVAAGDVVHVRPA